MDPQNRVDKFNSLVRGLVTLGLTYGFIYGFIVSKVVSVEAYIGILGAAIGWWFSTRQQQTRSTDVTPNGGPNAPKP